MKGRLAGTVGTNASKMVPETSGSTFSADTLLQLLSPWQWGQQMPGWEHSLQMSDPTKHQPQGRRWQTGSPLHHGNGLVINTTLFSPFVCLPPPSLGFSWVPLINGWQLLRDGSSLAVAMRNILFGGLISRCKVLRRAGMLPPQRRSHSDTSGPISPVRYLFLKTLFQFLRRSRGSTKNRSFTHLHPIIAIISLRQNLSNRNGIAM